MKTRQEQIQALEQDWLTNPRWNGVKRPYTAEEVLNFAVLIKLIIPLRQKCLKILGKIEYPGLCGRDLVL
jgi:isocitrate lyase